MTARQLRDVVIATVVGGLLLAASSVRAQFVISRSPVRLRRVASEFCLQIELLAKQASSTSAVLGSAVCL